MGRPTKNDSFEMGYSSALVCMASTNTTVVSEGVNVGNESGTGMENMVIFNLSNPGSKCPVKFKIQIEVCQIGWIILEYSRTAMFHWMFLEVKKYTIWIQNLTYCLKQKNFERRNLFLLSWTRNSFGKFTVCWERYFYQIAKLRATKYHFFQKDKVLSLEEEGHFSH